MQLVPQGSRCQLDDVRRASDLTCARNGRLTAQLARTEEAAKRALVASDRGAKGGVAGCLLATERELARMAAERADAHRARTARPQLRGHPCACREAGRYSMLALDAADRALMPCVHSAQGR